MVGVYCLLSIPSANGAVTIDYSYDDLNRLKTCERGDGQENTYGYDARGNIIVINDQDFDADGLSDAEEGYYGTSSGVADTDSDGLRDGEEVTLYGTNPLDLDSDNDGLQDGFEAQYGFDPTHDEGVAGLDLDGDTLTNLQEQTYGTSPHLVDSDNDGMDDNDEIDQGRNPAVNEPAIIAILTVLLSDDCTDSDGDGLSDCLELEFGTSPVLSDTDGDGLNDFEEIGYDGNAGAYNPYSTANPGGSDLDANSQDTDGDGYSDNLEMVAGADPLNPGDIPGAVPDGDLSGDGIVDVRDLLIASQIITGELSIDAGQLSRGDVAPLVGGLPSPDGQFNLGDWIVIQRKVLGLIDF